MINRIGDFDF